MKEQQLLQNETFDWKQYFLWVGILKRTEKHINKSANAPMKSTTVPEML